VQQLHRATAAVVSGRFLMPAAAIQPKYQDMIGIQSIKAILKGIVSRDSVSTETMGVLFEPKHCAAYQLYTYLLTCLLVVRQKSMMCQTGGFSI
jgi:hypothetical protein